MTVKVLTKDDVVSINYREYLRSGSVKFEDDPFTRKGNEYSPNNDCLHN
jgi:hypothetical protein